MNQVLFRPVFAHPPSRDPFDWMVGDSIHLGEFEMSCAMAKGWTSSARCRRSMEV